MYPEYRACLSLYLDTRPSESAQGRSHDVGRNNQSERVNSECQLNPKFPRRERVQHIIGSRIPTECHHEQSDLLPSGHHRIVLQRLLCTGQVLVRFEGQEYTCLYMCFGRDGYGDGE